MSLVCALNQCCCDLIQSSFLCIISSNFLWILNICIYDSKYHQISYTLHSLTFLHTRLCICQLNHSTWTFHWLFYLTKRCGSRFLFHLCILTEVFFSHQEMQERKGWKDLTCLFPTFPFISVSIVNVYLCTVCICILTSFPCIKTSNTINTQKHCQSEKHQTYFLLLTIDWKYLPYTDELLCVENRWPFSCYTMAWEPFSWLLYRNSGTICLMYWNVMELLTEIDLIR